MRLLEGLSPEVQSEIAVDMIIQTSNIIDREYAKMIQEVATFDPKSYKRWYDKNPNVHLAIELLRDLSEEEKEKIIGEFSEKITNLYCLSVNETEQK